MSTHRTPLPPGLTLHIDGGIARIRFNRPQALNAIDVDMAQGFLLASRELVHTPGLRAVVLSGEGRAFMAGGDMQVLRQGRADLLIGPLHDGLRVLARLDAPVLAVLQGAVAGAGVGVALAADMAIAADNTVFNLAYAKIGASLDGGSSWALPRVVGIRKAMELALLAESVPADEALRLGLVNRVVPTADLAEQSEALVKRLAQGPTKAYGRIRQLLRGALDHSFDEHLDHERTAFNSLSPTDDFREGVTAFQERRAPAYHGR